MNRLSVRGNRRSRPRIGTSISLGVPKLQSGHRSSHHTLDTASDVRKISPAQYENTFRLPDSVGQKFDAHQVEQVIHEVLESRLKDATYERDSCTALGQELANEIHQRLKAFQWSRYKFLCHVIVGQWRGQGIHVASRCVWDTQLDNCSCVQYSNKSLFVVAHCFGIYFE
ncbi:hypothetical protein BsWGS_12795 [Bradybaena similaris]